MIFQIMPFWRLEHPEYHFITHCWHICPPKFGLVHYIFKVLYMCPVYTMTKRFFAILKSWFNPYQLSMTKVNYGWWSDILNINGLTIWHDLSGIRHVLKLIVSNNRPIWIWSSWKFSENIPTWNRTFCLVGMVYLSGTACQISAILKIITWPIVGHFEFVRVENFQRISLSKTAHLVS